MTPKNILIVDDDEAVRKTLAGVLSEAGWNVAEACDGSKALGILGKQFIDIILTDIVMPKIGGMEFLKKIRSVNKNVPVVIYTGYPSTDHYEGALQSGATDFIAKPCESSELINKLQNIVGSRSNINA